ncbi:MAG TPA: Uma2 family endonuclease, partial [Tepidiformaceae bacterium]|nr:Uma2 family endonuclease [Tepidiformaceae bacterium]
GFIVQTPFPSQLQCGRDSGPDRPLRPAHGPSCRISDAAYWAPGRPSGDDSIPTLVVEVRSPEETPGELREKCRFYRRNGVEVCWLVHPESRTVEVFDEGRDGEPFPGDAAIASPALPGFTLSLAALFGSVPR